MAPLNPLTFYSFILLLLPPCFAQQSGWLDDPCSYSYGNFTPNSTYNSNLIQLLTNFSSIFPNNNGFYNISIGQNSDQIYGTALCRGDVRTDVYLSCVTSGARDIILSYKVNYIWDKLFPNEFILNWNRFILIP